MCQSRSAANVPPSAFYIFYNILHPPLPFTFILRISFLLPPPPWHCLFRPPTLSLLTFLSFFHLWISFSRCLFPPLLLLLKISAFSLFLLFRPPPPHSDVVKARADLSCNMRAINYALLRTRVHTHTFRNTVLYPRTSTHLWSDVYCCLLNTSAGTIKLFPPILHTRHDSYLVRNVYYFTRSFLRGTLILLQE